MRIEILIAYAGLALPVVIVLADLIARLLPQEEVIDDARRRRDLAAAGIMSPNEVRIAEGLDPFRTPILEAPRLKPIGCQGCGATVEGFRCPYCLTLAR